MTTTHEPLPPHLTEPPQLGDEIAVTGRWVPATPGGRFRRSPDSNRMIAEWDAIHADAAADPGVLSTEVDPAVGEDAVLVHHVFADPAAMVGYFAETASKHADTLTSIARPELHMVRGVAIPDAARDAIRARNVPLAVGEHRFGYVKDDYRRPDPEHAINVTAKWTCGSPDDDRLDELEYWWQRVGTDAFTLEEGLVRFEVFRVAGEHALIIHETFSDNSELKFHLTKGTAARYKKEIDQVAAPEAYFFRGPVSWTIRTYSKFMHLPATYTSTGRTSVRAGGSMTDGTVPA